MAPPNLPQGVQLHAAAIVDAAGNLVAGANIASVVRNGPGDYTVNLGTAIDRSECVAHVTLEGTGDGSISDDFASATDTSRQILGFDTAGAAADQAFYLSVWRFRT